MGNTYPPGKYAANIAEDPDPFPYLHPGPDPDFHRDYNMYQVWGLT